MYAGRCSHARHHHQTHRYLPVCRYMYCSSAEDTKRYKKIGYSSGTKRAHTAILHIYIGIYIYIGIERSMIIMMLMTMTMTTTGYLYIGSHLIDDRPTAYLGKVRYLSAL